MLKPPTAGIGMYSTDEEATVVSEKFRRDPVGSALSCCYTGDPKTLSLDDVDWLVVWNIFYISIDWE